MDLVANTIMNENITSSRISSGSNHLSTLTGNLTVNNQVQRSSRTTYNDRYDEFEQMYDPDVAAAERSSYDSKSIRPKAKKKAAKAVVAELSNEADARDGVFHTTYKPARFEEAWLRDSLNPFYEMELVTDVLAIVKGGKEANVYRCAGGPQTPELVAAKVYRPRQFRNLSNDGMYREGREVLKADGRVAKKNDHRTMRAIGKKSSFGVQVAHTSWLMYEFNTLKNLHAAGAAVPEPIAVAENAILMGYKGNANLAAPTLNEVSLDPDSARRLFHDVIHNIEIMLSANWIHGDLSAYNILYWEGEVTLIDFPQVSNAVGNSNARFILSRDVQRVCEYFALQGLSINARGLADHLWQRHQTRSENEVLADLSRTLAKYSPEEE
jgi:RIO kinase 1